MAIINKLPSGSAREQAKTVTAETSAITVTPDLHYLLSQVTVNPTPSEQKTQAASTSNVVVNPTAGKLLSKVTITPTPSETKTATPTGATQNITPSSGKLLSKVTVNPIPINSIKYTNIRSFWNDTDDQTQAETKTYTNSLTAGYYYLLVIVSASTGNHSSSYSYSGTKQDILNVNVASGNGLRIAIIRAVTAGTLTVSVTARSTGARNATGCELWRIYWN